jgi:branched-chain amino acid transport system substrate-binding protein
MKAAAAALLPLLAAIALVGGCADGDGGVEPVARAFCAELLYEGEGDPDVIIVSDLPLRGEPAETTQLMVDAMEFVLRKREFRAGDHRVGFQSCNQTVGDEFDAGACSRNARTFVETDDVVGVIGPFFSGCAELQIPIVSRNAAGPLAMISPSNTDAALTRNVRGKPSGDLLYPDGVRSYARVVTHDQAQGIAAAHVAARSGARRAVVLRQTVVDEPYANGLTAPFLRAAEGLGLETTQLEWEHEQSYARLAAAVAAVRPDAVYLAGLPEVNAKRLVEDLRSRLPRSVRLLAPDSFAADGIARELGRVGDGLVVTMPGIPPEALPPAGQEFVRDFGRSAVETGVLYAPEAAQVTQVLLDAIARSDGTRASVVEELFRTKVENGILGSFSFDRFGDIVPAPVTLERFERGKIVVDGVIRVPLDSAP